jgi:DNA-binding CsgD family transcriptional regulator
VTIPAQGAADQLRRGREAYARRAWREAYDSLSRADEAEPLGPEDLDALASSAFLLGRDDVSLRLLERAHHAHVEAGGRQRAVRSAFWLGMHLLMRGDVGPATGWLGRAQRLLEQEEADSVEHGYLLIPLVFRHEAAGELAAAVETARQAAEIGERLGDPDLFALATQAQGLMLIRAGSVQAGLALMDEAMVVVTAGGVSPIASGIVYCGVILTCQEVYELRRAQEWTAALTRWCEQQPELVAFTGRCLIHRAEIMQVHGAWDEALEEAHHAGVRLIETKQRAAGLAFYRQGELHRLRGRFDTAEEAYRRASRLGWEPQPGLALLRLAQGQDPAAAAAIRRLTAESTDRLKRAALLPACVEIMLAVGEVEEARAACAELRELAEAFGSTMLRAMLARARGAVELAAGDPAAALAPLRDAWETWQELEAPYEVARSRALLGLACQALGDGDAAELDLEAARAAFAELGAAPDLARLDETTGDAVRDAHGLTARELEVLRLVAAGRTNREIAASLVISEHTVARHVQNIFGKLRLSSRTAATAFAFEHDLV